MYSISVSLLKLCFALYGYIRDFFCPVQLSNKEVLQWKICCELMLYTVGKSVSILSPLFGPPSLFPLPHTISFMIRVSASKFLMEREHSLRTLFKKFIRGLLKRK